MKSIIISFLFLTKHSLSAVHWDYDDMSTWSTEYEMCGAIDESPINIDTSIAIDNADVCTSTFDWNINYHKKTFKITNNGHSIVLKAVQLGGIGGLSLKEFVGRRRMNEMETSIPEEDIIYLTLNENTIAKFPNYFHPESSQHTDFCLDSFHFHWGKTDDYGSEHTLNTKHYPLEAHFVHFACDHAAITTALGAYQTQKNVTDGIEAGDDVHVLGVVSIFFDVFENKTNPAFDAIFTHRTLEHIRFPDEDESTQFAEIIHGLDLKELIPRHLANDGYYAYSGSLTTPPCTDIVRWYVMNARGYIGKEQLEKFRQLMASENKTVALNHRDEQSNPNPVYACIDEVESEHNGDHHSDRHQYGHHNHDELYGMNINYAANDATNDDVNDAVNDDGDTTESDEANEVLLIIISVSIGSVLMCAVLGFICMMRQRKRQILKAVNDEEESSELDISDGDDDNQQLIA